LNNFEFVLRAVIFCLLSFSFLGGAFFFSSGSMFYRALLAADASINQYSPKLFSYTLFPHTMCGILCAAFLFIAGNCSKRLTNVVVAATNRRNASETKT
jgi:hypothetical protein